MATVLCSGLHLLLQLVAADGNCVLQLSASSFAAGGSKWQLMATVIWTCLHLLLQLVAAHGNRFL
jgi:uncharacterized protein YpbB